MEQQPMREEQQQREEQQRQQESEQAGDVQGDTLTARAGALRNQVAEQEAERNVDQGMER